MKDYWNTPFIMGTLIAISIDSIVCLLVCISAINYNVLRRLLYVGRITNSDEEVVVQHM